MYYCGLKKPKCGATFSKCAFPDATYQCVKSIRSYDCRCKPGIVLRSLRRDNFGIVNLDEFGRDYDGNA